MRWSKQVEDIACKTVLIRVSAPCYASVLRLVPGSPVLQLGPTPFSAHLMNFIKLACAAVSIACGTASAAVVSVGALTSNSDGSTSSILDSLNGREWLRWDVLKGLTFAQTVDLVAPGGAFDGWKIAKNADAVLFLNALIGPNSCTAVPVVSCVNPVSDDVRLLTGDSYSLNVLGGPYNDFDDYVYFLSDDAFGHEVGVIETLKFPRAGTSTVILKHDQWDIAGGDWAGTMAGHEMGWMLFRDTPLGVPEPGPVSLVLLGLFAAWKAKRPSD